MNRRTSKMNRYYWKVPVRMIQKAIKEKDELEVSENDIHRDLKMLFLLHTRKEKRYKGKTRLTSPTTRSLSTKEFLDYLMKIQWFAAWAWGIYIPDPDEETMCVWI